MSEDAGKIDSPQKLKKISGGPQL